MDLQLKKAQRSKAFLKLGLSSPSGGGKTLGALMIGIGLMNIKHPESLSLIPRMVLASCM
jgi:hypothetical protein